MWVSLIEYDSGVEVQYWLRRDSDPATRPGIYGLYRVVSVGQVVGTFRDIHAVSEFVTNGLVA